MPFPPCDSYVLPLPSPSIPLLFHRFLIPLGLFPLCLRQSSILESLPLDQSPLHPVARWPRSSSYRQGSMIRTWPFQPFPPFPSFSYLPFVQLSSYISFSLSLSLSFLAVASYTRSVQRDFTLISHPLSLPLVPRFTPSLSLFSFPPVFSILVDASLHSLFFSPPLLSISAPIEFLRVKCGHTNLMALSNRDALDPV